MNGWLRRAAFGRAPGAPTGPSRPAPPGSGCPQLHPPAATGQAAKASHLHSNHSASRRTHDLRHTAASLALQAGVPLKVVSEQLGHSSLSITADIYTSVLPAVAAAEAVAGIVPRAGGADSEADGNALRNAAPRRRRAAPLAVRLQTTPEGRSTPSGPNGSEMSNMQVSGASAASGTSAPGRDRTCDHRIRSPLLCPLSYGGRQSPRRPPATVTVRSAIPAIRAQATPVGRSSPEDPFPRRCR
jgi:hypothetical protein